MWKKKKVSNNTKKNAGKDNNAGKIDPNLREQILSHVQALTELKKLSKSLMVTTKEERVQERKRKLFHLIGFIIPVMLLYMSQTWLLILNLCCLIPLLIADYNKWILWLNKVPKGNLITQLLREHELIKGKLSGVSWLLIGTLLITTLFDKYIASLSMAILVAGDAFAAIIGKNFGRIRLCGGKSLEGTLAFIFAGFMVYSFFGYFVFPVYIYFDFTYIVLAIVFSAIVELVAKNICIDDNFAIPVVFCLVYRICVLLFGM